MDGQSSTATGALSLAAGLGGTLLAPEGEGVWLWGEADGDRHSDRPLAPPTRS